MSRLIGLLGERVVGKQDGSNSCGFSVRVWPEPDDGLSALCSGLAVSTAKLSMTLLTHVLSLCGVFFTVTCAPSIGKLPDGE